MRIRRGNFHQDHGIEFGETKNRKIREKKKKEEEKKGKEKEKKEKGKNNEGICILKACSAITFGYGQ